MSKHKLNKLLQETVYSLHVPDVKDEAKKVPINVTETKGVAKKLKPQRVALACVAMCCLVAICTCLGIFVPTLIGNGNGAPVVNDVTYVTVDINPSFTIKLVNGKVEMLSNNNKDGGIVLAGIDENEVIGKDFDTVINIVLKESAITGYFEFGNEALEKEKNVVKIGVMDENGNNIEDKVSEIGKSVKQFFVNNNMFALVLEDNFVKSTNDKILSKFGVTLSKYELIKSLYKEKVQSIVIEDSKQFKDFVNEYKDVRISDIYNELQTYTTKILNDIYGAINSVLSRKNIENFENHVRENIDKVNDKLDEFIDSKLKEFNESELIAEIKRIDNEAKDRLKEDMLLTYSQIIDELNRLVEEKHYEREELLSVFDKILNWFNPQETLFI